MRDRLLGASSINCLLIVCSLIRLPDMLVARPARVFIGLCDVGFLAQRQLHLGSCPA
jgi:hypothetical protein